MHLNQYGHDNTLHNSSHFPLNVSPAAVSVDTPRNGGHSSAVRIGHFLFRRRDYLFPLIFVGLILTTTPNSLFGSTRLDYWLDLVGLAVIILGQGCRLFAVGSIDNIRRRGCQKQIAARTLIRHGVFAHTRNPLYLGNLLIILGFVLIANSLWWYLLVLPGFGGAYWAIVLAEEAFLRQRFGQEYTEYSQTVRRFIPTLHGLHFLLTSASFSWRRALRKESGVLCTWLFTTAVLLVWEQWTYGEVTRGMGGVLYLLLMMFLALFTYRSVLWLRRWRRPCL